MLNSPHSKLAFSLVELSIVLVILGLLVGGILAGQSLVHAAELRAVSAEYQRYAGAINAFRDKYFALPGDMTNATSFWGDQATGTSSCASAATPDGAPGTCNGNGDGWVGSGTIAGPEGVRAWQHLQMAGMIEGNYTGYYISSQLSIGANIPASKLPNAGWALLYRGTAANQPVWSYSGNILQFGTRDAGNEIFGGVLTPQDAWNIDSKMDDGIADTGRVMGDTDNANCTNPNAYATTSTPAGRAYKLTNTATACIFYMKL